MKLLPINKRVFLKTSPYIFIFLNAVIYALIYFFRSRVGAFGSIEKYLPNEPLFGTLLLITLIWLYYWGHKNIDIFSFRLILSGYILFAVILLATPVLLSDDIYAYAMKGRVYAIYDQNPYLVPAINFPHDDFIKYIGSSWHVLFPQTYGPLWNTISILLSWLGKNSPYLAIFLFKLIGFIANSLILFLVYKIGQIFNPVKLKEIFFLYAWSPFLLLEFINNAHNDAWLVLFTILAFYFYFTKKDGLIIPSLVLAGLIKYISWLLIPLFIIFLYKEKRLTTNLIFVSIILSLIFLVGFYLPFFAGITTFFGLLNQVGLNRPAVHYNPLLLLSYLIFGASFLSQKISLQYSLGLCLLLERIVYAFAYLKSIFSNKNIIDITIVIFILFAFLASATVLPWYITWWLPFLILKNQTRAVIFWSLVGMCAYFLFESVSLSLFIVGGTFWLAEKFWRQNLQIN